MIVFCSKITLHDSLVGAIFLKGVENAVERHDQEGELGQVPVVGPEINLVVFAGYAHHFPGASLREEEEKDHADHAAADQKHALRHVHPYDCLHASEEG